MGRHVAMKWNARQASALPCLVNRTVLGSIAVPTLSAANRAARAPKEVFVILADAWHKPATLDIFCRAA